jgi:hypothetical protein
MRIWSRLSVSATLFVFASCAAIHSHQSVRKQLEREYASITAAFKRDDPSEWIRRLAPDFHLKLFNGMVQNREWVIGYVKNNAKTFHVEQLMMTIKDLKVGPQHTVATVEQRSSRTFRDRSGQHRLDVGAVQLETWERSPEGWTLKAVQEKELLYLLRDGKPPTS